MARGGESAVWMASTSWHGPGSIATVARGYAGAARSVGIPVQEILEPFATGFGPANYEISLLRQSISDYGVEGTIHSVGALGGRRDADIVTLHDTRPFWWNGVLWGLQRSVLRSSCNRARAILTFNATMRAEIGRYLGSAALEKTVAIPLPQAAPPASPPSEPSIDVLWMGRAEQRKHLAGFLHAVASLPISVRVAILWSGAGHLSGEDPVLIERLLRTERERGRNLRELRTGIRSDELERLFRSSRCLVSTSDYEGFHAPPAEAYVRGVRLVLPELPVYQDLYGRSPGVEWYARTPDLAPAILRALGGDPFTPDPHIVRSLSYESIGRQLKELYESVADR